jgi:SAM-dependent methyltransferase
MPLLGVADAVSLRLRRRKLHLFLGLAAPNGRSSVLDVGVENGGFGDVDGFRFQNFFEEFYPWRSKVTAVGLHDGERFRERYPEVTYVQADACALPFPDDAFDCYFSNAVVEHVGDRARQRAFVAEALRVAPCVFITTPNRRFPIEVHTKLPLVHWLPRGGRKCAYELARKPWAKEIELLDQESLKVLFPASGSVRVIRVGVTLVAFAKRSLVAAQRVGPAAAAAGR